MTTGDRQYMDRVLPARGRGAGLNPGNRFEGVRLHVLGHELDRSARDDPDGTQVPTEVYEDHARTFINRVDSPDLHFNWTINPYRGCEHGCIYCYARPTHEALGFSCGLDFETRILAKRNAPDLLRKELASPRWRGEPIVMSGITDPYQPIERSLRITRRCLDVMAEARQPVSIITKSRLVLRDLDLLRSLARHDCVHVGISVTSLDSELSGLMEPRAAGPGARLDAIRWLSEAGVPVMVMVAPVIPGLNDTEVPRILEAAAQAGALGAGHIMLRLPHQVKDLFLDWLARHFPDRCSRIERALRRMRDGELYRAEWGSRMRGGGVLAEQIHQQFAVFAKRFGLDHSMRPLDSSHFRPPAVAGQFQLFDDAGAV